MESLGHRRLSSVAQSPAIRKSRPSQPASESCGYFKQLADLLIQVIESPADGDGVVVRTSPTRGQIGFNYQRAYSGHMARPPRMGRKRKVRQKQGLFDIFIFSGAEGSKGLSHRELFEELRKSSAVEAVLRVWRGEDPTKVGTSDEEKDLLTIVSLMMFEQELNWGTENFQRFTFFPPYQTAPEKRRPRDMLMGFLRQAFDVGDLNELQFWRKVSGGETPTFKNSAVLFSDWPQYPTFLKDAYFDFTQLDGTAALMTMEMRTEFRGLAQRMPNNPNFDGDAHR